MQLGISHYKIHGVVTCLPHCTSSFVIMVGTAHLYKCDNTLNFSENKESKSKLSGNIHTQSVAINYTSVKTHAGLHANFIR